MARARPAPLEPSTVSPGPGRVGGRSACPPQRPLLHSLGTRRVHSPGSLCRRGHARPPRPQPRRRSLPSDCGEDGRWRPGPGTTSTPSAGCLASWGLPSAGLSLPLGAAPAAPFFSSPETHGAVSARPAPGSAPASRRPEPLPFLCLGLLLERPMGEPAAPAGAGPGAPRALAAPTPTASQRGRERASRRRRGSPSNRLRAARPLARTGDRKARGAELAGAIVSARPPDRPWRVRRPLRAAGGSGAAGRGRGVSRARGAARRPEERPVGQRAECGRPQAAPGFRSFPDGRQSAPTSVPWEEGVGPGCCVHSPRLPALARRHSGSTEPGTAPGRTAGLPLVADDHCPVTCALGRAPGSQ